MKVFIPVNMINTSQSLKDVLKEEKWRMLAVDGPLAARAQELFQKASPLDPEIYKGGFRSYSKSQSLESSLDTQKRMYEKSDSLNDWFARQRYDVERKMPPGKKGYDFGRDTCFEDVAKQYLMGEGKELYQHLKSQGREFYDITKIGTGDIGEKAVAGLAVKGSEAALIGSRDFEVKVSALASQYGVSRQRATEYVLAHELVHASQKGRYANDPLGAELDVEHTLKGYFTSKGYSDLAAIAGDRANNVARNYSGATYGAASPSYGRVASPSSSSYSSSAKAA
ncbi:hypothetical protein KY309_03695 [Candidatus Woesearchaeota archaeon]|nr:hypothetical protein [Candidatus Woesearchaeota archaeon]